MKICRMILSGLLGLILSFSVSYAQENEQSIILKTGTQGLGVELAGMASEDVSVRLGFNFFKVGIDYDKGSFDYNGKLTLKNMNLLVDWYPFEGGFHLTGGAVWDMNKLKGTANLGSGSYFLGNGEYTPAELGTITQEIDHRSLSPYLGLGFGRAVTKDGNWNVMADFGVIFTGTPRVETLSEGGTLSGTPALAADLTRESEYVLDDIKGFKFYPIASIGIVYSF